MNVASLDLCRELYELSRWENTEKAWFKFADGTAPARNDLKPEQYKRWICRAYDLGYLLRKLPVRVNGGKYSLVMYKGWHNGKGSEWYTFGYQHFNKFGLAMPVDGTAHFVTEAITPEDAAAKLAIELFKQSILQREATT